MTNLTFVLLGSSADTIGGNGQKITHAKRAKGLYTALKVLCCVQFTASWTGEIKQHSTENIIFKQFLHIPGDNVFTAS
jgi:hypothetical protein